MKKTTHGWIVALYASKSIKPVERCYATRSIAEMQAANLRKLIGDVEIKVYAA